MVSPSSGAAVFSLCFPLDFDATLRSLLWAAAAAKNAVDQSELYIRQEWKFYWPISARFFVQRWSTAESASPWRRVGTKQSGLGRLPRAPLRNQREATDRFVGGESCASSYLGTDLAAQPKGGEAPGVVTVLVQMANIELHAGMVHGRNELVGPRAAR